MLKNKCLLRECQEGLSQKISLLFESVSDTRALPQHNLFAKACEFTKAAIRYGPPSMGLYTGAICTSIGPLTLYAL